MVGTGLQTFEKVRILIFGMGVTIFRVSNPDFNRAIHELHLAQPALLSEFQDCYMRLDYPIHDEFDRCFADLTHEPNWPPALWWKPILGEKRGYTTGFVVFWPEAEKEIMRIFQRSPRQTEELLNLAGKLRQAIGLEADLVWISCEDDIHPIWVK